jgi:hypothetical protein
MTSPIPHDRVRLLLFHLVCPPVRHVELPRVFSVARIAKWIDDGDCRQPSFDEECVFFRKVVVVRYENPPITTVHVEKPEKQWILGFSRFEFAEALRVLVPAPELGCHPLVQAGVDD